MASVRDVPVVLRRVGAWHFLLRVWRQVSDDSLPTWAAAMAYSWLFAVFPFFIFLLSLVPYLPAQTRDDFSREFHKLVEQLPPEASETVWKNLESVINQPRQGLLSVGILVTLFAASGGMNMTMAALDRCYEMGKTPRPFYIQRPIAMGLTIIVMVMVLIVLVLLPIGTIAINWLEKNSDYVHIPLRLIHILDIARWTLGLVFMITTVAVIYFFGINIRQRFSGLSPGAIFTICVWILLGIAFRIYVERFGRASYDRTYGTVGGVCILLLFFYIDAVVLLIGAEINSEIDFEILGVERGTRDFRRMRRPEDVRGPEIQDGTEAC